MRRFVSMTLCVVIALLLTACGGSESDNVSETSAKPSPSITSSEVTQDSEHTPNTIPQEVEDGAIQVTWQPDYSRFEIETSNATLALRAEINGSPIANIQSIGVDLYDANGNLLTSKSEMANLSYSDYPLIIWYDVNSDLNYTLSGDTKYVFTMYIVMDDITYTSERYSFTTKIADSQNHNEEGFITTPTPTQAPEAPEPIGTSMPLLNGMEQNGQYNLTLYESGRQEVSDGTIVLADLMVPSTITDEEAQNILATDPEASYSNGGSYEEIRYSGGFLIRSAGESLWKKSSPSDVIELEVFSSGEVFIPYNAQFTDNMTSIMLGSIRNVSSLDELFHVSFMGVEFNYSSIEVQVTVSDGVITVVDMYYTP